MTTNSGEAPNERKESQQRKERGGAADIDRSKGMGTEGDSPFGSPEKDAAEPKKEAPAK
jgi:hypothetical protein